MKIIISLSIGILLVSCNSGTNNVTKNSLETFTTMPITMQNCAAAQFFSPNSMFIYTRLGNTSFCLPYIKQADDTALPPPSELQKLAVYYYGAGATIANTCPAIAPQSELPFPKSAQYAQDIKQTVDEASTCVSNTLSTNKITKPIFVFDIDDTLTGGYIGVCHEKFYRYIPQIWNDAVNQSAFVRLPYMDTVLNYAFSHNIDVAVITARPIDQLNITEQNLIAAFPEFTGKIEQMAAKGNIILKASSQSNLDTDTFKNIARQNLLAKGYTIVLNMGDQYSDLNYTYPYKNQPYCSYKLPNYMYYLQ